MVILSFEILIQETEAVIKTTPYKAGYPIGAKRNNSGDITHILFDKRQRAMSYKSAVLAVKKKRTTGLHLVECPNKGLVIVPDEDELGIDDLDLLPEV